MENFELHEYFYLTRLVKVDSTDLMLTRAFLLVLNNLKI